LLFNSQCILVFFLRYGCLGKTELDDASHITAELARNAIDCDTNRLAAESGMMACKKKWTYEDTRVF
jgi:hypothetical protein